MHRKNIPLLITVLVVFLQSIHIVSAESFVLSGAINQLHAVEISIECPSDNCEGKITYIKSGLSFELKGTKVNNELSLYEVDDRGDYAGYIVASEEDDLFLGKWYNHDKSMSFDFWAKENPGRKNFQLIYDEYNWLKLFSGKLLKQNSELILQKRGPQLYSGRLFFYHKQQSYELSFSKLIPDGAEFQMIDQYDLQQGTLQIKFTGREESNLKAVYITNSGQKIKGSFNQQEAFGTRCLEYADYAHSYGITVPVINDEDFDSWLQNALVSWLAKGQKKLKTLSESPESLNPQKRSKHQFYGWLQVKMLSDFLISGQVFFTNSWEAPVEVWTFNYNLDGNKSISITDFFRYGFNADRVFKSEINLRMEKWQFSLPAPYYRWLKKENFEHFTIARDGIWLSTNFNTTYGQKEILIPIAEILPHVKSTLKRKFL